MINGYCDPKFQKVSDVFSDSITSGFETGAALAIEYQGKMIVNLWGGYQDASKTKAWEENTLINVFSGSLSFLSQVNTAACLSADPKITSLNLSHSLWLFIFIYI